MLWSLSTKYGDICNGLRLSLRYKDERGDKTKKLHSNRCKLDHYIVTEKNLEWEKYVIK